MFDYKDQVVAVAGASSGLGRQMAKAFAKAGAQVVLLARRMERLEELKKEIEKEGGRAEALELDVTKDERIREVVAELINSHGQIHVLVNSAGSSMGGAITEMSNEAWDFTLGLDLTAAFKLTREFGKHMKNKGYGRIIHIASMYGLLATNQEQAAYHTAKAGVVQLSRAAAAELAPFGVTVNSICPGFFPTELTEDSVFTEEFQGYVNFSVPMKRLGEDGELNSAALFLGARESSYVTGIALPVDGGWSSSK